VRYFAYGSNMAAVQMDAWCEGHVCLGPARLPGRALEFLRRSLRWNAGAADIVPRDDAEVWGVLWELPDPSLAALDEKESEGIGYRRIEVTVEYGDELVIAWAYEVIDREPAELRPRPEYLELMLAAGREHGLPGGYLAGLVDRW
jgi:gamma-glutamylcyclotransferase (GGCT)/AIG2-like uncharacterized protein YtfP